MAASALAVFVAGCGGEIASLAPAVDAAVTHDLAPATTSDLGAPPDLASAPLATVLGYTGSAATPGASQSTGVLDIGRSFQVTTDGVILTELGIWDSGHDGLSTPHAVTLFALDHAGAGARATAIAGGAVVVPAGPGVPFDGGFRFAALPQPLPLARGFYAIVGYGFDGADPYGDGGNFPLASTGVADATFDPYQFTSATSPAFPSGGDGVNHTSTSMHYQASSAPFLRIMPYGDSITDGFRGTKAGYRSTLSALLTAAGVRHQLVGSNVDNSAAMAHDQMHHEGHPGFVIQAGSSGRAGIADSLDAWMGAGGVDPDIVLLMIGTNDVDLGYDLANAGKRLDALVTRISNATTGLHPRARLLVAQITPIVDATEDARVVTYNQQVAAVVASHAAAGEHVALVDMHSVLDRATDFTDNLHPNDVGYAKVGQAWYAAIMH